MDQHRHKHLSEHEHPHKHPHKHPPEHPPEHHHDNNHSAITPTIDVDTYMKPHFDAVLNLIRTEKIFEYIV